MLVSNHVMGNPRKRYNPVYNVYVDDVLVFRNEWKWLYQEAVTKGDWLILMMKKIKNMC